MNAKSVGMLDFRSDTVTKPTPAMMNAITQAALGDDVYGEDPTVHELQRLGAEMLGKEAALFVPSGTMGNLISVLVHAPRGSEVILGDESHIYHYEQGGASAVGSLVMHPVPTQDDGSLSLDDLQSALRNKADDHSAWPGVVCLENTHNRRGGKALSLSYLRSVQQFCQSHDVPLHLDGARLANAAVAVGLPMSELAACFDSVQLDLSKGLGAPVGGLVAGSHQFVTQAKRIRKLLGGGMRQAGIIAAAGVVALNEMVDRLADDHRLAQQLAVGLAALPGVECDPASVETNLVLFRLHDMPPSDFVAAMRTRGVLLGEIGNQNLRMVTHYDVNSDDVEKALETAASVLKAGLQGVN